MNKHFLAIIFLLAFHGTSRAQAPNPKIESPRIATLWSEIQSGEHAALSRFWDEIKGKTPLWERISPPGSNNGFFWGTYVWHGDDSTQSVFLQGGLPSTQPKALSHLPGTDVWYRSEYTPSDSRIGYDFIVVRQDAQGSTERKEQLDPLNPRTFLDESVLEMPYAPAQPWVARRSGVPQGEVASQTIYSRILEQQRDFAVYTPANYKATSALCNLVVLFDGQAYVDGITAPVILDNLIAAGAIAPTVLVLIKSNTVDSAGRNTRTVDLTCDKRFADFVVSEMVPWVRSHYRVSSAPSRAVIGGHSLGGLQATYVGFTYPGIFGNVLSESGSFFYFKGWPMTEATLSTQTGWLTKEFTTSPRKPLRLYLETGTFEGEGVAENRRMRDVLIAKGYSITYYEYSGGHDQLCWQASFADGLLALLGSRRPGKTARVR